MLQPSPIQSHRRELVALAAAIVAVAAFGPWVTVSARNLGGLVGLFAGGLVPEGAVEFMPDVSLSGFDIGRGWALVLLAVAAVVIELTWRPPVALWKTAAILALFGIALVLAWSAKSEVSALIEPSLSQMGDLQADPQRMLTAALAAGMVRTGWGMTAAIAGAALGCATMIGCLLAAHRIGDPPN